MKAVKLTSQEIKDTEKVGGYNYPEWVKIIDRYSKFKNVEFYLVKKDEIYQYDRFFVTYELPEGLKILNTVTYHSMISDSGFTSVVIMDNQDGTCEIIIQKMTDNSGKVIRIANHKEGRKWMASKSSIFTTL